MAKSTKAPPGKGEGPPDPKDRKAFQNWLEKQPREWSVTIAARAALRVLPLVHAKDLPLIALQVFRATAITRFAAKYPNRTIEVSLVADAGKGADAVIFANLTEASANVTYAVSEAAYTAYGGSASAHYTSNVLASAVQASASAASAIYSAVKQDALRLDHDVLTAGQLARDQLWPIPAPAELDEAWQRLRMELHALGHHWQVWIDWYQNVALHEAHRGITEAEDAAFTDIPGILPWDDGAEAVNTEIARRLQALREGGTLEPFISAPKLDSEDQKTRTIARLAEIASPQPSITDDGRLDAGPNQPFDVPTIDEDLSTLPVRQRNLIKVILADLPKNAPKHLKSSLRSYDDELKVRGAQPILGLLKDDADIIAAAVAASRAEDEWLEPGMCKAFDRFDENHTLFVEHFPLDAEREAVYAGTPLDEDHATGRKLIEPFEMVAKAAQEAHKAGAATDDFLAVIDKMTEFARVVSSQPPASSPNRQSSVPSSEIKISPEDRIQPVTTKKRVILGALGFFERTYALIGTTVTIATASYAGMAEALKPAIEMLSRLLR